MVLRKKNDISSMKTFSAVELSPREAASILGCKSDCDPELGKIRELEDEIVFLKRDISEKNFIIQDLNEKNESFSRDLSNLQMRKSRKTLPSKNKTRKEKFIA